MTILLRSRSALILVLLCGFVYLWGLGSYGLFDLDEGLYVQAAREMHLRGDFVTPRVNGEPFFEKPPLAYWAAAGLFGLFGESEFTARLPAALASSALCLLVYGFGRRFFGEKAGMLAGLAFVLSPLVFGAARQLTMDALLDLWIALALFAFFRASVAEDVAGRRLYYGFWAACALGVLTKGAPGLLFPAGIGFLLLGFRERWAWRRVLAAVGETKPLSGFMLFLVIAVPWHVLAYRLSGDAFWGEYIIRQHVARFRGGDTSHLAPFWFYLPVLLLGFFPWSLWLPLAFRREPAPSPAPAPTEGAAANARLLLRIWCVFVFVFFSVSGSKLVSYILPLFAAAALLTGDVCARRTEANHGETLRRGAFLAFSLALLLFLILLFREPVIAGIEALTHRPVRMDQVPAGMLAWATHLLGAVTLGTGAFVLVLVWRKQTRWELLATGMVAFFGVAIFEGFSLVDRAFSAPLQSLTQQAGQRAADRAHFAFFVGPPRRPSALFGLPDSWFTPPTPGSVTCVPEIADTAPGEPNPPLDAFLARPRPLLLLTDRCRADSLRREAGAELVAEAGAWRLLRFSTPQFCRKIADKPAPARFGNSSSSSGVLILDKRAVIAAPYRTSFGRKSTMKCLNKGIWAVITCGMVLGVTAGRVEAQQMESVAIGNLPRIEEKTPTVWAMSGYEIIPIKNSARNATPLMRTATFDARTVEILSRTQAPPLRASDIKTVSQNGRQYIVVRRYLLMEVMPEDARAEKTSMGELARRWAERVRKVLPQIAPTPNRFGV